MPSALPINNRRKPNYLITPSHCVQTELPVADNKYLISVETGRINQGCRQGCMSFARDLVPGVRVCLLDPLPDRLLDWPQTEWNAGHLAFFNSCLKLKFNKPWFPFFLLCFFNKFLEKFLNELF